MGHGKSWKMAKNDFSENRTNKKLFQNEIVFRFRNDVARLFVL